MGRDVHKYKQIVDHELAAWDGTIVDCVHLLWFCDRELHIPQITARIYSAIHLYIERMYILYMMNQNAKIVKLQWHKVDMDWTFEDILNQVWPKEIGNSELPDQFFQPKGKKLGLR